MKAERLLVTTDEAAVMLGVSRQKIYNMLRDGDLPSVKLAGSRRIATHDLREWIAARLEARAAKRIRSRGPSRSVSELLPDTKQSA